MGHQGLLGHCTIYRQLCPLPPFPASDTRGTVSHSDSEVTAHKDMPLPIPWQRWVLWAGLSSSPGWRWTGLWRPPCSTPHTLRAESAVLILATAPEHEKDRGQATGLAHLITAHPEEEGLPGQSSNPIITRGRSLTLDSGPALPQTSSLFLHVNCL